jgi:hypothetical protein
MAIKRAQLDSPAVLAIYTDLLAAVGWKPDDPRVPELADRLASFLDSTSAENPRDYDQEFDLDDELVYLLVSVFIDALPIARRLLRLLEERGWYGWTRLERFDIRTTDRCRPTTEPGAE